MLQMLSPVLRKLLSTLEFDDYLSVPFKIKIRTSFLCFDEVLYCGLKLFIQFEIFASHGILVYRHDFLKHRQIINKNAFQ